MGLGKIVSDVELHNLVYNPNPNLNGWEYISDDHLAK